MSSKKQLIIIIGSTVACMFVVIGALLFVRFRKPKVVTYQQHPVSKSQLAKADGKSGRDCYVAIDGTVYQIKDFSLWQDGKHVSSNGLAYCGADLSKVIDKAPHGRKVLDLLIKIGPLTS